MDSVRHEQHVQGTYTRHMCKELTIGTWHKQRGMYKAQEQDTCAQSFSWLNKITKMLVSEGDKRQSLQFVTIGFGYGVVLEVMVIKFEIIVSR
jgi:hypothetical protein